MQKSVTRKYAIESHCHECLGHYEDGKKDCLNPSCPLYPYMPYRDKSHEPDLDWTNYNPRKKGKVTWTESQREMSDMEKTNAKERLKKARQKKKFDIKEGNGKIEKSDLDFLNFD